MPSRWMAVATLILSGLALQTSVPAGQSKRPMTLVDLLNIPRVGDPRPSPDGRRITFLLATTDWPNDRRIPQVWIINADGSGLRQLTSMQPGAGGAQWSPDGSTVAFLSKGQIFLVPASGGSPRQLSQHPTTISEIAWDPDGGTIYFLAADPPTASDREQDRIRGDIRVVDEFKQRHLWKIGAGDGAEKRITDGDYSIYAFRVARHGKRIVVSRRPTPLAADTHRMELWTIDSEGHDAIRLTHNAIPEEDGSLSPDRSQVLFIARANDRQEPYYNSNVFVVPASGGQVRAVMPDFAYEVLRADWAADGKSIWMVVNMGVHAELVELDLASHKIRQATKGDHALVPLSWNTAGDRHVFMVDEPTRIGDVWTWAPGDASPRRVTGIYDYLDRDFALPRQQRIEWKGADGVAIEGILTYPIDYQPGIRYPLVVQLHGGPEDSDRFGWGQILFNYQAAWAARGYAILRPNYRGSSGYGNTFYREPIGGYFKNSHLDVLAGVDHVISMGVADPERLAVMGWSAGAHLVNKLITYTNRFKAASSGAGVANWISLYGQSDTRVERDLWLNGSAWQRNAPIQTYWDHSPLKYISSARTPTLFLIGENDPRVPPAQSLEMFRALKAQGVPTEMHVAPGEGHIWLRPAHQLHKMNAETAWFEEHVTKRTYAPEEIPRQNDLSVTPAP